ncbi:MAG TPA: HAD-IA family hydrolase [Fimbriimonas sp.]
MRALIFDFDGLILDTETPEVETWQAIFAEHGCVFPDEWWMNAIGRGAEQVVSLPEDLLEEQLGRALDRPSFKAAHRARLLEAIHAQPIRPGVLELARACRQEGVRVGIASSSHHEWVEGHLARLGVENVFEEIVCAEDAPRGKPFPDLYLEALRRFGVASVDAVALEDSPNGILAAKSAGIFCVAVPNPASGRCDLSRSDRLVPTLEGVTLEDVRRWWSPASFNR